MMLLILVNLMTKCLSDSDRIQHSAKDRSDNWGPGRRHRRNQEARQFQQYELWKPSEVSDTLLKWKTHYSDLIRVTTSQDAFGLDRAGDDDDCPYDNGKGCLNYYFVMQDFVAHPEGSDSSNRLPEVMWSGEVHGDEQVGPTAVLEAAQLLMDAAQCQSLPRVASRGTDSWEKELQNAQDCREALESRYGIDDSGRKWLARLITTRRIVVIPTANALGYYRKVRTENSVDPNRDFPYDLRDPKSCMQTIAARTLNEVFREHMFQLSLTFHGGMEVIGYEWGAPHWRDSTSPDDSAQHDIAAAYSHYGGGWSGSDPYQYGDMNSMVYPVNGGMEDWAYAGSWDPQRVIQCQPESFGGYDANNTVYSPSTLRVFNMLVESSNQKIPSTQALGTSQDLLKHDSVGTGYVSRNIRLSLMSAELVEPYVTILEVNELQLSDDLVPLVERGGRSCQSTKTVSVPADSRKVVVQWEVGGSLTVDTTQLWYAKWSEIPFDKLDCLSQPSMDDIKELMKAGTPISDTKGSGRFNPGDSQAPFSASIDISSGFAEGDELVVLASARVDQNWMEPIAGAKPALMPQSHLVNVRTNSLWHHESAGKVIRGRLDWFSAPLTIVLRKDNKAGEPEAIEMSNRINGSVPVTDEGNLDGGSPTPMATQEAIGKGLGTVFVAIAGIILTVVIGKAYFQHRMRQAQRSRVREFIADESAPTPGLRRKQNGRGKSSGYSEVDEVGVELGEYA